MISMAKKCALRPCANAQSAHMPAAALLKAILQMPMRLMLVQSQIVLKKNFRHGER